MPHPAERAPFEAYLLGRRARVPVRQAVHDEAIVPATIYVAPPDMHLARRQRPSRAEPLEARPLHPPLHRLVFESVAGDYGKRAIGVILTGSGIDGATGIRAIKRMGGTTIVQDPSRAAHPGMPQAAYATGCIDYRLPLEEIGHAVVELVAPPTSEQARVLHE